ncbi:MAG TPA: hypothetical protein VJO35_18290 [Terriglobales bacterium]|nr:hypothetical protein [Terriglobales bacterium]
MRAPLLITLVVFFSSLFASAQNAPSGDMSGMDMSQMSGSNSGSSQDKTMRDMPGMQSTSNAEAMHSMEGHHMDMGPHMKMTGLRPVQPGDQEKADEVAVAARAVAEKYKDYKVALADGYRIFLPNVPQKQYHFTNYWNASQARNNFDPSKPTSLLYEKEADGYKLIGVMYTAKKDATEDELNARIPLSVAQWHAHVNMCLPPRDTNREDVLPAGTKFGLRGSIATKEACDAAGGKFMPQIFGWMVHVYPFEKSQAEIWSVERQHNHMD